MHKKKIDEEAEMFEITEKASDKLKELLKDKEDIPGIRIVLSQGG